MFHPLFFGEETFNPTLSGVDIRKYLIILDLHAPSPSAMKKRLPVFLLLAPIWLVGQTIHSGGFPLRSAGNAGAL
jgi:hypothetical protein